MNYFHKLNEFSQFISLFEVLGSVYSERKRKRNQKISKNRWMRSKKNFQKSKKIFSFVFAFAQCEWVLNIRIVITFTFVVGKWWAATIAMPYNQLIPIPIKTQLLLKFILCQSGCTNSRYLLRINYFNKMTAFTICILSDVCVCVCVCLSVCLSWHVPVFSHLSQDP